MATEKLKFKLELYATMWDKPPVADIKINEKSFFKEEITSTNDKPTIIEFEHELEEGKSYSLIIDRLGKDTSQCKLKDGKIIKDQLLFLIKIMLNDMDIEKLIYSAKYTVGTEVKNEITVLGQNATWCLEFETPLYMWFLENTFKQT